ncbi:MAG: bifunctional phosphoribosylaminoimidazolecarboxamide formyltransferase/IMP cyclohydrolase [bacterium]
MAQKSNALISVSDKTGIVEIANVLIAQDIRIYSTGGTAKNLHEAGIAVSDISELTHFPEIMEGRIKTLHPKVFGGILARRKNDDDSAQAAKHEIPFFDVIVVNLYPFAETIRKQDSTHDDAIENIDIGGVSLIRAAAKNYEDVAVVTSPAQYESIIVELKNNGTISQITRRKLALQAFHETANYDAQIHNYFATLEDEKQTFPENIVFSYEKIADLRYGENPHQKAALYKTSGFDRTGLVNAEQLQGKELSYNNIMDADTALNLAKEYTRPTIAILKHANPCGVASAGSLVDAYRLALSTDNVSAFGGIIGANREIDVETAKAIFTIFAEVVIAPGFAAGALEILAAKKNLRLLQTTAFQQPQNAEIEMKAIAGGILLQDKDLRPDDDTTFKVATLRKPTEAEWQSMLFGWKVVKWVKSNAVIYARDKRTLGIGAGQMSRVDSSRIAAEKAKIAGFDLAGSIVASDAFFPFADGVETAAAAGATAVIQPGGSIRDDEVIEAANKNDMAMVFTGVRHFRH